MSLKIVCFQISTAVALGLGLAACSGSGARVEGSQCPKRWEPVRMNIHPSAKLAMAPTTLPDGKYALVGAALHFHGDPTAKSPEGFQVLIKEDVPRHAKSSELVAHTDCFRNANVDRAYAAEVPGFASLDIEKGQVKNPVTKMFGFTMDEYGQFTLAKDAATLKSDTPLDLFNSDHETFVVKLNEDNFEIRTKGRATNGEYTMTTFLHRTPLPPPVDETSKAPAAK